MAKDITGILRAADAGDRNAIDAAFGLVYAELRQIAHRQLGGHPKDTLSTTGLVHETYLKLIRAEGLALKDRQHFFNLAARAMRQVMLDRARSLHAQKRPEGRERLALDGAVPLNLGDTEDLSAELIDLDRALTRLAEIDKGLGELVGLRLFAGLEFTEISELLGVSERTLFREWRKARAILLAEIGGSALSA